MKIVAGIDHQAQGDIVLKILHDLDFPEPQLKLVNVIELWTEQGSTQYGFGAMPTNLEGYFKRIEEESRSTLLFLQENAKRLGFKDCQSQLLYGNIGNQLMDHASAIGSDILALGSMGKGPWEGIIMGSVGRKALINAKQSVLIAKEPYRGGSQLSVVLATDHSPYAKLWLERFAQWAPRGIRQLTLLTVLPEMMAETEIGPWIREGLQTANARAAETLKGIAGEIQTRVATGPINATIAQVMQDTHSDLLVLGSQGHGFMERIALGSTSLEQAMKQPYSVLVVRA